MSVNHGSAVAMPEEAIQRTSAGSSRSAGSRSRQTPQQQLSTIEKSVTHLLVATKQLLETLTMWSTARATEGEVSDVYVRLGYEFNIACRAFNAIGVDTADLGPVPDMLRTILEETLSQEASQPSLERYLPRIRDIIINLLHGLKKKQQRLRQKSSSGSGSGGANGAKDSGGGGGGDAMTNAVARPPRHASTASTISVESSNFPPQQQQQQASVAGDEPLGSSSASARQSSISNRTFAQRQGSVEIGGGGGSAVEYIPPRTTSAVLNNSGRVSPQRNTPQQMLSQNGEQQSTSSSSSISYPDSSSSDRPAHELPGSIATTAASHPSNSSSLTSSANTTLQNIPVLTPYPQTETMPSGYEHSIPPPPIPQEEQQPPPSTAYVTSAGTRGGAGGGGGGGGGNNDALTALQRGGELERRASRRFSAYQISKHLGPAMNGLAALPPAQNSPVPNRGRDARESLHAVRSRASVLLVNGRTRSRPAPRAPAPGAAAGGANGLAAAAEIDDRLRDPPPEEFVPPHSEEAVDSPTIKTPEDKLGPSPAAFPTTTTPSVTSSTSRGGGGFRATSNGPLESFYIPDNPEEETGDYSSSEHSLLSRDATFPPPSAAGTAASTTLSRKRTNRQAREFEHSPAPAVQYGESEPPQQYQQAAENLQDGGSPSRTPSGGKDLTLFLQYKSKIKKITFAAAEAASLSVPRLQLAFIEKFAWNTHNNGVDLPEIYLQDPISGVRHELEDLADVRDRSVLVLNVEVLDEVKRHFDEGLGGLRRVVEGIRSSVEEQGVSLQLVSERQQKTAKDLASIAAAPPVAAAPVPTTLSIPRGSAASTTVSSALGPADSAAAAQAKELQSLRRDLAVVRQTYTSFASDITTSMATIRTKAAGVKAAAANALAPSPVDAASGRAYVDRGKQTLHADSEHIVNRVDDLQDLVEDLRKDVVTRGVRPLPRQLEAVSKDISLATAELQRLQQFLKREKPLWTKIWERELQVVCDDRDLLTMQEELATDLEDDLEKAAATFALVEEATKQQNLQASDGTTPAEGAAGLPLLNGAARIASRNLGHAAAVHGGTADPHKAKDSLLGEVRALSVNHESRLEAIERAERARQRELESRDGGEFKRELGKFVETGQLKKSGGVEEVERVRRVREEKTRREVWERTQARLAAQAERQAAAAAAAAQAATTNGGAAVDGAGENAGETAAAPSLDLPPLDTTLPAMGQHTNDTSPEPEFVEAKESSSPSEPTAF